MVAALGDASEKPAKAERADLLKALQANVREMALARKTRNWTAIRQLENFAGVKEVNPVTHAYKLVSRDAKEDAEILPVLWEDNYFSLLPGESRQVKATYAADPKSNANPIVEIEGWNVNHSVAKSQQ